MIRGPVRSAIFSVVRPVPLKPAAPFAFGRMRQGPTWLLAGGVWSDAGEWSDGATWNDGA